MKKPSRMETSKECRRVLNRHGVDLTRCYYSCSGSEIRLFGLLYKVGGGEFHSTQIETMIQDFQKHIRGIGVYGDLDNWSFTSESITFIGDDSNERSHGADQEGEVYIIDLDDGEVA